MDLKTKQYRLFSYDIISNNFETLLQKFIHEEIMTKHYGIYWKSHIPPKIIHYYEEQRHLDFQKIDDIGEFLDSVPFINLKRILLTKQHFPLIHSFFGDLTKQKFGVLFNILNRYRNKIAHPDSSFVYNDLCKIIEVTKELCQGEYSRSILEYLNNEKYSEAGTIPKGFFVNYQLNHNLPEEEYNQGGGFVGREEEIEEIIERILSGKDRIITISGAGGAGKSAIALKIAYSFLEDEEQLFDSILWFSAKTETFTETGIKPTDSQINEYSVFIEDILKILNYELYEIFNTLEIPLNFWKKYLYNVFSSQKCLIIIDNLEPILRKTELIEFIVDIPRPSSILITSRKGLGRVEWPISIRDMLDKDAISLFKLVARTKRLDDLLKIDEKEILRLVKNINSYPLLIKWSIAKYQLVKPLKEAFEEIFEGDSELCQFVFNSVFILLNEISKNILYSILILGNQSKTKPLIKILANITEEEFEDHIFELERDSLVFHETRPIKDGIETYYNILSLTKGYLEARLNEDVQTKLQLVGRYHDQIKQFEESISSYQQTLLSLGVRSTETIIAYNHVKTAKQSMEADDVKEAAINFEKAISIAPQFDYPYTEFSKFEAQRRNMPKALELAKKATLLGPKNFHTWFNLGILLKKNGEYFAAIEAFSEGIKVNQDYLPNYSEIGFCHSIIGEYEVAEGFFNKSIADQKNPNFRHLYYAYTYQAENYLKWSLGFRERNDYKGETKILRKAEESIQKTLEIKPNYGYALKLKRETYILLGRTLGFQNKPEAVKYLEESIADYKYSLSINKPNGSQIKRAKEYIAKFTNRISKVNDNNKKEAKVSSKKKAQGPQIPKDSIKFQQAVVIMEDILNQAAERGKNIRELALDKLMRDHASMKYRGVGLIYNEKGHKSFKKFSEFILSCEKKGIIERKKVDGFQEIYLKKK